MANFAGFIKDSSAKDIDFQILDKMASARQVPSKFQTKHLESAFFAAHDLHFCESADASMLIAIDGQVLNLASVQNALIEKGYQVTQGNIAQIIQALWSLYGPLMLEHLDGDFALALWDLHSQTLLLARDRMGQKPLFWGVFGKETVFASSLASMLAHPEVPKRIDPTGLHRYLTLDCVPAPNSIFQGIKKVPPGAYVLIKQGNVTEGRYHDLVFSQQTAVDNFSEASALIWQALLQSTKDHLQTWPSDSPGLLLSGGIDSSAVLVALLQQTDAMSVKTFTLGFNDASFDESSHAQMVSSFLGTDHHTLQLDGMQALQSLRRIVQTADQPLADSSLIPTYALMSFARQHVTKVFSGDGGDEFFYGYPTFSIDRLGQMASYFPLLSRQILPKLVTLLPASEGNMSTRFKAERFIRGLKYPRYYRHFAWLGSFAPDSDVLSPEFKTATSSPYPDVDFWAANLESWPPMKALSVLYARLYLAEVVLTKVDMSSKGTGLEVSAPLLNQNVVDLALSMPVRWSISGSTTKKLLRRMLRGRLPDSILDRPKKGFGAPMAHWFRTDLKPLLMDHLTASRLVKEGFFNAKVVNQMIDAHISYKADYRKELYSLLFFEMWLSRWVL